MDITKEHARKLIENDILVNKTMPIHDKIILRINNENGIKDYTFIGLLKYVYDLN